MVTINIVFQDAFYRVLEDMSIESSPISYDPNYSELEDIFRTIEKSEVDWSMYGRFIESVRSITSYPVVVTDERANTLEVVTRRLERVKHLVYNNGPILDNHNLLGLLKDHVNDLMKSLHSKGPKIENVSHLISVENGYIIVDPKIIKERRKASLVISRGALSTIFQALFRERIFRDKLSIIELTYALSSITGYSAEQLRQDTREREFITELAAQQQAIEILKKCVSRIEQNLDKKTPPERHF